MMKINTYTSSGVKSTPITAPKDWTVEPNMALLAQANRVYEDNVHTGTSKTKTRSEVTGSRRKIYRQKGTGGARHGAKSAPIFVGGSKAHGPKIPSRKLTLPDKMKKKALVSALGLKLRNGNIVAIKTPEKLQKTKEAAALLEKIKKDLKITKSSQKFTIILSGKDNDLRRVTRNIQNLTVIRSEDLNAHNVFRGGLLIFNSKFFVK